MDNHQVSLVAQERKESAGFFMVFFHAREHGSGSVEDVLLIRRAKGAPGGPAHAKHLVQDVRPIQRQRHSGEPGFWRSLFIVLHSVTNTSEFVCWRRAELAAGALTEPRGTGGRPLSRLCPAQTL